MNRFLRLLTALAVFATATALAALPPQHQRSEELRAIGGSFEIAELFWANGLLVEGISRIADDEYVVSSGNCELTVTVVDVPAAEGELPMVGPRNFELQLGELYCS